MIWSIILWASWRKVNWSYKNDNEHLFDRQMLLVWVCMLNSHAFGVNPNRGAESACLGGIGRWRTGVCWIEDGVDGEEFGHQADEASVDVRGRLGLGGVQSGVYKAIRDVRASHNGADVDVRVRVWTVEPVHIAFPTSNVLWVHEDAGAGGCSMVHKARRRLAESCHVGSLEGVLAQDVVQLKFQSSWQTNQMLGIMTPLEQSL